MTADEWVDALQARHRSAFTSTEFLKAVRALSARYVERRSSIREKSPLDSAGKRAAFAAFYAPLHFFTARQVVRQLPARATPPEVIVDLGCGTGIVSAAWALELASRPRLTGIDAHPWALTETAWNWRQLGLHGEQQRAELVRAAERLLTRSKTPLSAVSVVAGWSVNELSDGAREQLLPVFIELASRGAHIVIIEPLARSAVPWWRAWELAFVSSGGQSDEWRFDAVLPPTLAGISEAAGFRREELTARSLSL
jgi:hypothetical protein